MTGIQFVLHVSAILLLAHHHQCQLPSAPEVTAVPGDFCQSIHEGDNHFRTQCSGANAVQLRNDFENIVNEPTKRIIDLTIRDSDISGLLIHKDFLDQVQKLQLDSVRMGELSLPELLSKFSDLQVFMLDNIREKKITLQRETFSPGQPIQTLILGNNDLTDLDIDNDAFENIKDSLKSLTLRENQLTHLPSAVAALPNLRDLDLSGNPIKHFSDDETNLLRALPNLETININDLECKCDQMRENFFTYVKEKGISLVRCSPQSKFPEISVLNIDLEESCKYTSPNPETNPKTEPDGSNQMKVAVLALTVTVLPLFLK